MGKRKDRSTASGASDEKPLAGYTLAVVGPAFRKDDYSAALQQLGAEVLYAASDEKKGRIAKICGRAQGVLFINTFTSHSVFHAIREITEERMIPMKVVTFKGKDRLVVEAIEMVKLIEMFSRRKAEGSRKRA